MNVTNWKDIWEKSGSEKLGKRITDLRKKYQNTQKKNRIWLRLFLPKNYRSISVLLQMKGLI